MPQRKPFVFSLQQNFLVQLASGQLFYRKRPDDLINRLSPIFFIGIGGSQLITGPYELIGDIVDASVDDGKDMARMLEEDYAYGLWQELRVDCPYSVPFRPLVNIKTGIIWDKKFCQKFDILYDYWRKLIEASMEIDKINLLAEELKKINKT